MVLWLRVPVCSGGGVGEAGAGANSEKLIF